MSTTPRRATRATGPAPGQAGPDLTHLHPDRLSVGGVGVFAGDWAGTDPGDGRGCRYRTGFVGTLVDRWNGWAVFAATREVAEAIVADQQQHRLDYRESLRGKGMSEPDLDRAVDEAYAGLSFDGDTIVADQRGVYDDPDAIERITPGPDRRYIVMGWNWCWQAVDPATCDRIVGQIPAPGQEQEYVMLVHTDLCVPHTRVAVTSLRQLSTHNGVAFTAQLSLDGQPLAGTIENNGNGGATALFTLNGCGFDWRDLAAYAAASRLHGQPATQERVLDALVDEFQIGQEIITAAARGATLARLYDEHGYTRDLHTVTPAPARVADRAALAGRLAAENPAFPGAVWQLWTGSRWEQMTAIPTRPQPTTGI